MIKDNFHIQYISAQNNKNKIANIIVSAIYTQMCHNLEYNLFTRQYSRRTAEKNVSTTGLRRLLEVDLTHRRVCTAIRPH